MSLSFSNLRQGGDQRPKNRIDRFGIGKNFRHFRIQEHYQPVLGYPARKPIRLSLGVIELVFWLNVCARFPAGFVTSLLGQNTLSLIQIIGSLLAFTFMVTKKLLTVNSL